MSRPNQRLLEFLTSENPLTLAQLYNNPIRKMIQSSDVIGSGAYGQTHKICLESSGRDCVLVKENFDKISCTHPDAEYNIPFDASFMTRNEYVAQYGAWQQTKEYPFLIPRPIKLYRNLIFMQLILNSVIFRRFCSDNLENYLILKSLFFQALGCWALIERKYPNFTHSDLHGRNLLVSTVNAPYQMHFWGKNIKKYFLTIIDFGLAKLDQRNPQMYHEVLTRFQKYFDCDDTFFSKFIIPALAPFMKPLSPKNDYYNKKIIESLVGEYYKSWEYKDIYLTTTSFGDKEDIAIPDVRFSSEALLKLPFFDDL
jgi:hypothetical protein